MTGSDLYFRDKIPVTILGATGCVGQKFVQLLARHPWFQVVMLCASERSVGKKYRDAVSWYLDSPLPKELGELVIQPCLPNSPSSFPSSLLFSALDGEIAGEIESACAAAGFIVVSNARSHRMEPFIPLLIGEVNPAHLALISGQSFGKGMIITNPNCSVMGMTLALKPLFDRFGVEGVHVVTLQAISGAGYPGIPAIDILDNIIPWIHGEEEKVETEPLKILGEYCSTGIQHASFPIFARCNRVPVTNGHMAIISVKLREKATAAHLIEAWQQFSGEPQAFQLPTAPFQPLHYFDQKHHPQPKLHRTCDKEMAVTIGKLKPCKFLDYSFTILSHNMSRGAAGAAILNAELLLKKGYIYW